MKQQKQHEGSGDGKKRWLAKVGWFFFWRFKPVWWMRRKLCMFVFSRLYCIRDRMASTMGEVSLVHLECVECVDSILLHDVIHESDWGWEWLVHQNGWFSLKTADEVTLFWERPTINILVWIHTNEQPQPKEPPYITCQETPNDVAVRRKFTAWWHPGYTIALRHWCDVWSSNGWGDVFAVVPYCFVCVQFNLIAFWEK